MKTLTNNSFIIIALVLAFLLAECIINPIGNFPLNDDWVYGGAAFYYKQHHSFNSSFWGCASMFGHILYVQPFINVIGCSYTVLRFSTLLLACVGVVSFYLLLTNHFLFNKKISFFLTLMLLSNPLFLNLANSYMTDAPFVSLAIIGFYVYCIYKKTNNGLWLILSAVLFAWCILIRQLGVSFVIGIFLAHLFSLKKTNILHLLFLALSICPLFIFEYWFSENIQHGSYNPVFQRTLSSFDIAFFKDTCINFSKRWIHYVSFSGLVLSPLLIPYLINKIKSKALFQNLKTTLLSIILFLPVLYALRNFPLGNYLYNVGVGPQTLYDTYILNYNHAHSQSTILFYVLLLLTIIGSYGLLFLVSDCIINIKTQCFSFIEISILFSIAFYYSFLAIPSAIFDRYIFVASLFIIPIVAKRVDFKVHAGPRGVLVRGEELPSAPLRHARRVSRLRGGPLAETPQGTDGHGRGWRARRDAVRDPAQRLRRLRRLP